MTKDRYVELLLDDALETLVGEGAVSLYELFWFLRGLDEPPPEADFEEISRAVVDEITRRYELELIWSDWLDRRVRSATGEDLDFQLRQSGEYQRLILKPREVRSTAERGENELASTTDADRRRLLDELLEDTAINCTSEAWVFGMAVKELFGPDVNSPYNPTVARSLALELIQEALMSGLMVAGDLDRDFEAWSLSPELSFARVRDDWIAGDVVPRPSESIVWFEITPKGRARAQDWERNDG